MTCRIIRNGILCTGREPTKIFHNKRTYFFEWSTWSGWLPCNDNGDERKSPVPNAVWDRLMEEYPDGPKKKEQTK